MSKNAFFVGAMVVSSLAGTVASANWGLKYEVSTDGITWKPVVAAAPLAQVHFRMSAYFDIGTKVQTADGIGDAVVFSRFTGQQQITGMVAGDVIGSMQRLTPQGNSALLTVSGNLIGGTSVTSFATNLLLNLNPYIASPLTETAILRGVVTVGTDATTRTLVVKNNVFGVGTSMPGLRFYSSLSGSSLLAAAPIDTAARSDILGTILVSDGSSCPPVDSITASGGGTTQPSQSIAIHAVADDAVFYIWTKGGSDLSNSVRQQGVYTSTLSISDPFPSDAGTYEVRVYDACGNQTMSGPVVLTVVCGADLSRNGVVDDTDFILFGAAYSQLECPGSQCAGDLNVDGLVDDADFVLFAAEYSDFTCPS